LKEQDTRYETVYEVSLATTDTEFEFNDDLVLYGFSLKFTGCKMKIIHKVPLNENDKSFYSKGYCSVEIRVKLST
jgi:hypothetical protein